MVELTPVQRRTLDLLGRRGDPLVFDAQLVDELRAAVDEGLAELADHLTDGAADGAELFVTKHGVAGVLTCEASWASPDSFAWSAARARGQVAHRAIQLSMHWRDEVVPTEVVDAAIERLADEERGLGDWLAQIDRVELADLRSRSVEHVTKFLECFPPLDQPLATGHRGHQPVPARRTDHAARQGRPDPRTAPRQREHQGHPRPEDGPSVATASRRPALLRPDRDADPRLPPRLLATYSLDSGMADTEVVTEGVLRSALRRTLDAIQRMVEVRTGDRPPTRNAGPQCRWCALRAECPDGQAWMAADADPDE